MVDPALLGRNEGEGRIGFSPMDACCCGSLSAIILEGAVMVATRYERPRIVIEGRFFASEFGPVSMLHEAAES